MDMDMAQAVWHCSTLRIFRDKKLHLFRDELTIVRLLRVKSLGIRFIGSRRWTHTAANVELHDRIL